LNATEETKKIGKITTLSAVLNLISNAVLIPIISLDISSEFSCYAYIIRLVSKNLSTKMPYNTKRTQD
jgi:O-antigen/teichoic acid export membrane protein